MNFLARIKLWQWFLFTTVVLYMAWNPWFSLYQLLQSGVNLPVKVLVSGLFAAVLSPMVYMSWHSKAAVLVTTGLLVSVVAVLWQYGLDPSSLRTTAQYWVPAVAALILTVGFNWKKVWRSATGQVATYNDVTDDVHH